MRQVDIDSMSDEEVAAYLSNPRGSDAQRRPHGAPRSYAVTLVALALIGMFASAELIYSEINFFRNPNAALLCDVNRFVGCSKFFTLPVNTFVLDIPNALLGVAFFAGMVGIGCALLAGAAFRRWLWVLIDLSVLVALVFLLAFITISVGIEHVLCPWCTVVWAAVIPIIVHTAMLALAAGHGAVERYSAGKVWALSGLAYAVVLVAVVIGFWDAFASLF